MKKIYRNGLFMLVAGALAASCADYNVTDDYTAAPDPTVTEPYKNLAPVKSYIDRSKYPNLTLGTTLKVTDFNKQELSHAAAVTNFDNVFFGNTLMSGSIINDKGLMNFFDMKDLLDHVEEIGGEVYGSPIVANSNQADGWLSRLTAPIEINVDYVPGKTVNYNDTTKFSGTVSTGAAAIAQYDNQNTLRIGTKLNPRAHVNIVEGFKVDPLATYTITFYAKVDIEGSYDVYFSGNQIGGRFTIKPGKWQKVVVEGQAASDVSDGYLRIENTRSTVIYIQKVEVGYYPDNHRPQTVEEKRDTVNYALNAWCDGLMKINEGRIKSFDLIDEAIDNKTLENGMYDLKHSDDKVYWQDIFGSENYAPVVSQAASKAYSNYGGNASELKFFISESGLDNETKFQSLMYWINIWDQNGAKIDGINAKLNLTYSEDPEKQSNNIAKIDKLLDNLASTGKLIRISNFDIKYQDASGANVTAKDLTEVTDESEEMRKDKQMKRQRIADFYAYVIKSYMSKISNDKQAGICKGNMADTTDPVGLWSVKGTEWSRTAAYKAFCDALNGK